MEIALNQPEAFSLYRFYRYHKNDIIHEMVTFYCKYNIEPTGVFLEVWNQYLEQFAEYKRKGLNREVYIFRFNDDECEWLLTFTNKIQSSFIYKALKDTNCTDDYIERLQNSFNIINNELKKILI